MFKQILQSRLYTVIILLLLVLLLISVIKIEPALLAIRKETKNLGQKIADVKKTDSELEKIADYLKSPSYLERQAKLKLNYKKPDEKVVYVYRRDEALAVTKEPDEKERNSLLENIKKWWELLIGR